MSEYITNKQGLYMMPAQMTKEQIYTMARELAIRYEKPPCFKTPSQFYEHYKMQFLELPVEKFLVVYLNRQNNPIEQYWISSGSKTMAIVDIQELVRGALMHRALSVVCMHNHPSGEAEASPADINLTHKIKDALAYFKIRLLDHIIICSNEYYSLYESGDFTHDTNT